MTYEPDLEARWLAAKGAGERAAAKTAPRAGHVNLSAARMRADLAAAEDPLDLDGLGDDGTWTVPAEPEPVRGLRIGDGVGVREYSVAKWGAPGMSVPFPASTAHTFTLPEPTDEQVAGILVDLGLTFPPPGVTVTPGSSVWVSYPATWLREPLAEPDAAAELNRKRHGASAWCPRHGPTKGGLCRKCTR